MSDVEYNNRPQPPDFDQEEGQVTEAPDIGTLAVLNKSEIDQQISTARRFPRSIVGFRREALQLATLDERTAAECIYALPRGGKTIEGPSARFAEIVNYSWGNTRAGARVVSEDDQFVTAQGLFYDLEKNTAISYEVQRRITDSRNRRYNADMIGVTSNAASSIALRNAILKGIPKALWKPIYDAARQVVAGDIKTLANRRDEALKAFAIYGIQPAQIYATLGIQGVQDITIDHMVTLKGMLTAIQEGDTTPEQAFAIEGGAAPRAQAASQGTAAELAKKYANGHKPSSEGPSPTPEDPSQAPSTMTTPTPPRESAEPSSLNQGPQPEGAGHRRTRTSRRSEPDTPEPQGIPLSFDRR